MPVLVRCIMIYKRNLGVFLSLCLSIQLTAQSHGVPGSKEQYLLQRKEWIQKDRSLRFSEEIELDSLEQVLNYRLIRLRQQMIRDYKQQHFFPPARYFIQSKEHIEQTDLFRILRRMPKGGILHLHGAASGTAGWVVDRVILSDHAYVFWERDQEDYVKGQINFYRPGDVPRGFYPASQLNHRVRNFADSLKNLLTFSERIDGDSVDIWGEFEKVFQRLYGFVRYQPVFKEYFRHAFEVLLNDGIQHVEIRGIFNELYDLEHPDGYYTADSTIQYYRQLLTELQDIDPSFSLKVIYTALRFHSQEDIRDQMLKALELRKRYPDLITGFDLVAEEDAGHPTLYFLDNWMLLDSLELAHGIDMPLYLHDGESNWVSVDNLYDAVLLNSRRIGHGFNLFRFPYLLEEVKKRDICLEINPLSNQILGYIRDLRMHPGSTYLARGIPCIISSDDPLIFNYEGLSYDFWEVFLAWELDLKDLKQLTLNSLKYSGMSAPEKELAIQQFHQKWNEFVRTSLAGTN